MFNNFALLCCGGGGDTISPSQLAPSGRRLTRHRSNMGTVLEFTADRHWRVVVLDAKYRANRRFGARDIDSTLAPLEGERYHRLNPSDFWRDTTTTKAQTVTDEWINANFFNDPKTGRQNCDVWMALNAKKDSAGIVGVPGVAWCRSIQIEGRPCDMPNFQTLLRIYCDAEALDGMDPTLTQYPTYALGSRNPQGAWTFGTIGSSGSTTDAWNNAVWTSSDHDEGHVWYVNAVGNTAQDVLKSHERVVVPVFEL